MTTDQMSSPAEGSTRTARWPAAAGRLLAWGRNRTRPLLVGEILVVLLLVQVYDHIRDIATTRAGQAMDDARQVLSIESWLHVDIEPSMNAWLSAHLNVEWLASWYYQLMHLSVTLGVLVWLYLRRPVAYRPARNALILVNGIGLVVFWLLPVAPPRLLAGFVDSGVASGVAQHVTHISPDVYAAMPSLHIGWATWVVLQVWTATESRTGRWLAAGHLLLTVVVVLATANHFVLDVAAGALVGVVSMHWSLLKVPVLRREPAAAT